LSTATAFASMSVSSFAVSVAAIWSPTTTVRARVTISVARVMVSVSVEMPVTRTISVLAGEGTEPAGQIVALNGGVGNRDPCPAVTTREVPEVAGDGAVATVEMARFLCGS
jgi:hypothetical protein